MKMEQNFRSALEAGHETLYHYESFCEKWLTATLRNRTIHCSNPAHLNDPWDCRPCFDDQSFETQKQIDGFASHLQSFTSEPIYQIRQRLVDAGIYQGPAAVQKILAGLYVYGVSYISTYGIYCLTPDPCSIRMWSHYADNHMGICLEFRVRNSVFANALEVLYRSRYPVWTPHSLTEENAAEMILTKAADWAYEKEFRVIARPELDDSHPLRLHGHSVRLPDGALASVIVGCQGNYRDVRNIVSEHAPGLPVKRAVRTPNNYALVIEGAVDPLVAA